MKTTKEEAKNALYEIENLVEMLDFAGTLKDDELEQFYSLCSTLFTFIEERG